MQDADYLTSEQIQAVIGSYSFMRRSLLERKTVLEAELIQLDSKIYEYIASHPQKESDGSSHGTRKTDQLEQIIIRKDGEQLAYRMELQTAIRYIEEELQMIQRIHLCYLVLPFEEHNVLRLLYEKKLTWQAVREEMGIQTSRLAVIRRNAMSLLRIAYTSRVTQKDLLSLQKQPQSKGYTGFSWKKLLSNPEEYGSAIMINERELLERLEALEQENHPVNDRDESTDSYHSAISDVKNVLEEMVTANRKALELAEVNRSIWYPKEQKPKVSEE